MWIKPNSPISFGVQQRTYLMYKYNIHPNLKSRVKESTNALEGSRSPPSCLLRHPTDEEFVRKLSSPVHMCNHEIRTETLIGKRS